MGYETISLQLPTDYSDDELRRRIGRKLGLRDFSYAIENKSLDACRKSHIHWLVRVAVVSDELDGTAPEVPPPLEIPYCKTGQKAVVVGSGPAGFFAALVLQRAGIDTTIVERGADVETRVRGIAAFEKTGVFDPTNNYAFGEGGAGTFSDGKLTSRSKHIACERQFILSTYVEAGAPEEIRYLAHPHLGSDNLRKIVKRLRESFVDLGGRVLFETLLTDLIIQHGRVGEAVTTTGSLEADTFVIAPGHSAHETYRMLIGKGVAFRTKNFAIGCRIEHPQELINLAQWGRKHLPGVKAAEYRLTSNAAGRLPVYTFCMCPGGVVIPAAAYPHTNIVNGMSAYKRAGRFANAACVAGIGLDRLLGREVTPLEALDWLGTLEADFYNCTRGYAAPYCGIGDFLGRTEPSGAAESSYPLGLKPARLWELLPAPVSAALGEGLKDFARKIKGFETGNLMGLESKTSSPIQVVRDKAGLCTGFENLYLAGEGSGYAGGIISSAADGIKAAVQIATRAQVTRG
jgi:uncharacterized protein